MKIDANKALSKYSCNISDSRNFWIYVCLKQWVLYWLIQNPAAISAMDNVMQQHKIAEVALRLGLIIDEHMHQSPNNYDDVRSAFRVVDTKIWNAITEVEPL